MKLGIDARAAKWYRGTGIGNYTYQLISSLNNKDKENNYLLFLPENCSLDIKFNKNFSTSCITEKCRDSFWDEVNIPCILENNDIELYHVPQNGIGLPKEKSCRFVITLHDIIPYKLPETVGKTYLEIFTRQMPDIIKFCDGIITVSDYSKSDIAEKFSFPKEKIFVTPLYSDKSYKPLSKSESRNIISRNYSIDFDYILYTGGFSPRKNIIGLMEAYSSYISMTDSKLFLVIAGSRGQSYSLYKKRAEELKIQDRVIFPGFISQEHMPYLYNAASLFVYPSFYEGFGLPPLEAMACGTPVIASNTTSMPEVLKDSVFYADPCDTDKLCEAIGAVLENENLKNSLIQKGFKRSKELNWERTIESTLAAYEKILRMSKND